MRVLVACEYSGKVRDAFIRAGHDAMSCDLLPTESPGPHYEGGVMDVINDGWDLMVAHPPCTHLAVSGATYFKEKAADGRQGQALDFVQKLMDAPIPRIAIENPVSIISSRIRKPEQIIQPWMFGHPERKTTCLWLKGLPKLTPTDDVKWDMLTAPKNVRERILSLGPSEDRWKLRSTTYEGVADAMGSQWGRLTPVALDISRPGEFPFSSHLIRQDAVELLESIPRGTVNCIITDPAYESLEKHRYGSAKCRRLRDENWFKIFPNKRFRDFFAAAYRAMAKNSHLYVMCDEDTLDVIKPIGRACGFTYWKAAIWDRVHRGQGYHYANTHEFVAFFEKGKRNLNDKSHLSIVRGIPRVMPSGDQTELLGKAYPTEKPVGLYTYFLENSTVPGDLVVDPFCGSGNSALAALSLGCDYIGGDTSVRAIQEASHRARLYHKYMETT